VWVGFLKPPGELRDGFQRLDRALGTLQAAFQEPTVSPSGHKTHQW